MVVILNFHSHVQGVCMNEKIENSFTVNLENEKLQVSKIYTL